MKRTDPQREYAAFISYRHVSPDKVIAKILQFLLEYNLVRPNKQVPRHIRKVFLDVSELPTLEDLDAGILQALDKAECLFVICSPDLPESKYCMREISYFKEKHGGSLDRVATLLVRGDPRESYPELLRTKQIPDPQDPSKTIQVEVEPLYADVRAKTLLGSVWKLVTTEYLRLACRYFRCSYDVLKKRHKRNAFSFLLAALVLIGCVTGLLAAKEQRVQQTVADSYGAYAAEQTRADNELLALALCTYTDCKDTESYRTALRSAVVQLDHKQRNQPVAKMLEAKYFHGAFTHYFLSSTENKLVVSDDNVWQIIDAHNGAVLLQLPCESAFVLGAKPDTYVMLESHPDEQGIFRDYVVLTELETDRVIAEIPFRESSGETPEYDVITNVETGELLLLTDHGEPVAFFTSRGQVLSREEFIQLGLERLNTPAPESDAPFLVVRDKRLKTNVVKNRKGNVLLDLGKEYQAAVFSDDNGLFACAAEGVLTVYDTNTWTAVGSVYLEMPDLQSLRLLSGSGYYLAGYRVGSETLSYVCDWRTGEVLLTTEAVVMTADREQAFYTVQDGTICRYQYTDLATDSPGEVLAHRENRCLSGDSGSYLLRDTTEGRVLLQTDALQACPDEELTVLLLRLPQSLVCCDGSGAVKWERTGESRCAAMAPDGSCAAWLDSQGDIQVHRVSDGEPLRSIPGKALAAAGNVRQLVCSDRGVGVLGDAGGLWIPNGEEAVSLGSFTEGTLFSDGILVLESGARVNDFRLYDTAKADNCPPFADNTGKWAYAPKTGYLVRHVEASGNNPSLYLEIWRRKAGDLTRCGRLELTDNRVEVLHIDGTGEYLSLVSDGRSRVCRLKDGTAVLDAGGQVYYEAEALYGSVLYGEAQYRMPMHDTLALRQWAKAALTSPVSTRTLTDEEAKQYSVSQ